MPTSTKKKPSSSRPPLTKKLDSKAKLPKSSPSKPEPDNLNQKIQRIFELQKKRALELRTSTAKDRIQKLKKLREAIFKYQRKVEIAIFHDFRKSHEEVAITEILPVISEINDAIRHLKTWMKPKKVETPPTLLGASSRILYEPKGVCLIIGPWNYPFHLAMAPLVASIAAGNTNIIKPSEFTPETSRVTRELLDSIFDEAEVAVIEGDASASLALTELPFDHIFFTGSTGVGKIIMERAAKHLTSVTLELGGKSPVILDETANVESAAERIMWGKFVNAGQTCVAPDYLLIHESKLDSFIQSSKKSLNQFFGEVGPEFKKSQDFCRIINDRNFQRVVSYIQDAKDHGAKIALGGNFSSDERFISPTILTHVTLDSKIMNDEIFGPLLPVITYRNLDDAIHVINSKDKPLALYIFSSKSSHIEKILKHTSAGGTVINDVMIHLVNANLPFGGVNHSGHGSYHGHFGFKAFSHERSVLKQAPFSVVKLMYPPYSPFVRKVVALTMKLFI